MTMGNNGNGGPIGPGPGFGPGGLGGGGGGGGGGTPPPGPPPGPGGNPQNAGMRELMNIVQQQQAGKNGGKINPASAVGLSNLPEGDFRDVTKRVQQSLTDLKQLIKTETKNGASQAEIDKLVRQFQAMQDAARILIQQATKRYGTATDQQEKARWDRIRDGIEKFLDSLNRSNAPGGGNGWNAPKPPKPPKPPKGSGSSKTQGFKDLDDLIKDFRGKADSLIAGKKGWTGNPYTADQVAAFKNDFAEQFSRFFEGNKGGGLGSDQDENTLIARFTYAMRRFEIALREEKQKDGLNLGTVASMTLSTLGASNILNKLIFDDPMRYRTMPALQAMSSTGMMGNALSAALAEQKQYQNERNQYAMNTGFGIMTAGLAGMYMARGGVPGAAGVVSKGRLGKWGGAVALGGALVAGAGAMSGITDNDFASKTWDAFAGRLNGVTSKEVLETSLASQFNKPEALIQRLGMSKQLGLAYGMDNLANAGQSGMDGFGNYNQEKTRRSVTGNFLLDKLATGSYMGASYEKMGFDADAMGGLLSSVGSNIRGKKGESAIGLAQFAAGNAGLFGGDAQGIIEALSTAQSAGGNDLRGMVKSNMAAASDENGRLDQFAINVISPAIGRVTQSLSIRNLNTSAEKLNEQVSTLYRAFSTGSLSDSKLGSLIARNPEMLGQILGSFGAGSQALSSTEQGFFEYARLGLDPVEYARGGGNSPEGLKKFIERFYSYYDIGSVMGSDGRIQSNSYLPIANLLEKNNIGRQEGEQLLALAHKNGGVLDIGSADFKAAKGKLDDAATENADALNKSPLALIQEGQVRQTNMYTKTVQSIQDSIVAAQANMQKTLNDSRFMTVVSNGIARIDKEMGGLLASLSGQMPVPPKVGGVTPTNDPDTAPTPAAAVAATLSGAGLNSANAADVKFIQNALPKGIKPEDVNDKLGRINTLQGNIVKKLGESATGIGDNSGSAVMAGRVAAAGLNGSLKSQKAIDGGFIRRSAYYNEFQNIVDRNYADGKVAQVSNGSDDISKYASMVDFTKLIDTKSSPVETAINTSVLEKVITAVQQKYKDDPVMLNSLLGKRGSSSSGDLGGYLGKSMNAAKDAMSSGNKAGALTLIREILMTLGVNIDGDTTIAKWEASNKEFISRGQAIAIANQAWYKTMEYDGKQTGNLNANQTASSRAAYDRTRDGSKGAQEVNLFANSDGKVITVKLRAGMSHDDIINAIATYVQTHGIDR